MIMTDAMLHDTMYKIPSQVQSMYKIPETCLSMYGNEVKYGLQSKHNIA